MMIPYEDLLSGDAIMIDGVGHFRSPQLKEMNQSGSVSWQTYNTFIYVVKSNRDEITGLIPTTEPMDTLFLTIINNDTIRELYRGVLDFFMLETVLYDADQQRFVVIEMTQQDEENIHVSIVGEITEENLDDVREVILRMNYISLKDTDIHMKFSSKAAEDAWLQIQKYQKQATERDDSGHTIGNMISKLCAIHPSYNIFNIYDLTVFQFYDAFFQSAYMRSISFSEAIVSNHGSDSFNFNDWMKPVNN